MTRAIFLFLVALTFPATVHAGARYQVTGEASIEAMPDLATISLVFMEYAESSEAVLAKADEDETKVIDQLKVAGVAGKDIDPEGEKSAVQVHNKPSVIQFGTVQLLFVRVPNFAMLPKLTALLAAGHVDWSVSYSFEDRAKFADRLGRAAVADATRKADIHAKDIGLKGARVAKVGSVRICMPVSDGLPPDCLAAGDKGGDIEIVVTARRRDPNEKPPQPVLHHAAPALQKLTATIETTFELR